MEIFTNINENIPKDCIVTIGIFDGLHLGHRFLLQNLIELGKKENKPTLVITLWPHPAVFFKREIKLLNTLEEKLSIFEELGIENVLLLEFNKEIADLSTKEFVDFLKDKLNIYAILKGYNNLFGKKGSNKDEIPHGVKIILAEEFKVQHLTKISSTEIRKLLNQGNVNLAEKLLGYKYSISGEIINGYKIGRKLGFPTANIGNIPEYKMLPSSGVYAVTVNVFNKEFPAMLNIGYRPSFDDNKLSIEFHIPNFNGDLYGGKVSVKFFERLRDEIKFQNINDLIKQLEIDKLNTIEYFNKHL